MIVHKAVPYLASLCILGLTTALKAGDWPKFLGQRGDGTSEETTWNQDWPKKEPHKLWEADVGTGCSSIAVSGGKACTLGQREPGKDTVSCFDAKDGHLFWQFSY